MTKKIAIILVLLNIVLLLINLYCGSVEIAASNVTGILVDGLRYPFANPSYEGYSEAERIIVLESRLPAALCALLTGAALGTCGLLLQSYFRNPLAGPSILGITSGAQLMVALVALTGWGSMLTLGQSLGLTAAAMTGSVAMLALLLWVGHRVRHAVSLLIVGMLLSYLVSAILTLLNYHATAEGVQSLLLWGMGTFHNTAGLQLLLYSLLVGTGLVMAAILIKPLNGWMLGEEYAQNMGIDLHRTRLLTLLCSSLLCAVTTAWCGPIAFVGLSMPHVARMLARTDNHRALLPLSLLLGAFCCNLCLWLSNLPEGGQTLPINSLTPILGIPVILWVVMKGFCNLHNK